MLCETGFTDNWLLTFALNGVGALLALLLLSGTLFWKYYWNPKYEQWRYKTNPEYPRPSLVRAEIIQMLKGMGAALIAPTTAMWLTATNRLGANAYCGVGEYGWGWLAAQFVIIFVGSDFYEWAYHSMGHTPKLPYLWAQHKYHHQFHNPSPWAVIADEPLDQFVRALPLLIFPMIMPTNMDLLFGTYVLFFYGYGVYLHWGFELDFPDAHHPWINTSFQHYCHHARASHKNAYHCGFFIKLWDQLAGQMYDKKCFCSKCARENGERTPEAFELVKKWDYSVLFQVGFWLDPEKYEKGAVLPGVLSTNPNKHVDDEMKQSEEAVKKER